VDYVSYVVKDIVVIKIKGTKNTKGAQSFFVSLCELYALCG
jgi:hypothetical protein